MRNQEGQSPKQGIQATWSVLIHLVKWWISCFRVLHRTHAASRVDLFLMLVSGFWPLYNVTRRSVWIAVSVPDLLLHFTIIIIIIIIITRSSSRPRSHGKSRGKTIYCLLSIWQGPVEQSKDFSKAPESYHWILNTLIYVFIYLFIYLIIYLFFSENVFILTTLNNKFS